MAIPELPFWSIKHNWREPVTERLEWLTDVLISESGAEQRRMLRLSPRRYFEYVCNPTRNVRTMLDSMFRKLFSNEWLIPLWHDQARLSAAADAGSDRIELDNTYREFVTGGWAVIFKDAFTYELVEIEAQDDTGLDLAEVTSADWPSGAAVYPLRRGWMTDQSDTINAITGTVGEAVVGFVIPALNDYDEGVETFPLYLGHPVMTTAPNRVEPVQVQLRRATYDRDGSTGLLYRADEANRAFDGQSHSWMVSGREARHAFRQFLYRLGGRQRPIWMPSFNDDLFLAQDAADAATTLHVEHAGLDYVGLPFPGRQYLYQGGNGYEIASVLVGVEEGQERVTLETGLADPLPAGTPLSFMDIMRLDQDALEITHHADSDGPMECAAVFKAFSNTRDPSGVIFLPIPGAAETNNACGEPEDTNPCAPQYCVPSTTFHWDLEFNGCNTGYCPTRNWYMPQITGHPDGYKSIPNLPVLQPGQTYEGWIGSWPGKSIGGSIAIVNNCGASGTVYESDAYINPAHALYQNPAAIRLQGQPLIDWSTTNGDFTITIYGALVDGGGALQIQYGAFWCGSFVATGNLTRTLVYPPTCSPVGESLITNAGLVGNTPYTWNW